MILGMNTVWKSVLNSLHGISERIKMRIETFTEGNLYDHQSKINLMLPSNAFISSVLV